MQPAQKFGHPFSHTIALFPYLPITVKPMAQWNEILAFL
jgi:hypothetical protein